MKLSYLTRDLKILEIKGNPEIGVSTLCYDSRKCVADSVFTACRGVQADGHLYLDDAIARGAKTVIHEAPFNPPPGVTAIRVADCRLSLGILAGNYFRRPSTELTLVGVTGTNGKTTVTYLIESILQAAGLKTGVIGTINYRFGGIFVEPSHTTPESYEFHRILREMSDTGVTHVVAEISSHALDQKRVDACDFDLAVFTNLSQDHLDYHGTMENYFQAKKRLFTELLPASRKKPAARAVINCDDPWGHRLISETTVPVTSYGLSSYAAIRAFGYQPSITGIEATINTRDSSFPVESPLIGRYNLENILAAATAALELGIAPQFIRQGVASLVKVPGRLERISHPQEPSVIVDYAHTDDALFQVLTNLRQFQPGKVITVFGCGGNRDKGKRPKMGRVASSLSDICVITSDNPRTEDPAEIIADIEAGIDREAITKISPENNGNGIWFGKPVYLVIEDRRQAVRWAINRADVSDIVLIAGKGHEDYQLIGKARLPFDDRIVAREALNAKGTSITDSSGGGGITFSPEDEEISLPVSAVLAATGGRLLRGDQNGFFLGISTDSRSICKGNLFIPLAGTRFDGHDFIEQALNQGAAGFLSHPGKTGSEHTGPSMAIEVPDTLVALGQLAGYWRRRLPASVIAITGSAGKTTTKEMTAAILGEAGTTLKTRENYNNLVGLPLTIFRLRDHHRFAVLELGMSVKGEISRLTRIAKPNVGLITNVGPAHLENLGTLEAIREEKGDLFRNLPPEATAVINLDDNHIRLLAERWRGNRVTFSLGGEADVVGMDPRPAGNTETEFLLKIGVDTRQVRLPVAGTHQVRNALAAAACARACGVNIDTICHGLRTFSSSRGRFHISRMRGGAFLIDDSYNANPLSVKEALTTMASLKSDGRAIAILGDMLELGEEANNYHEGIGALAAQTRIDLLLVKGNFRQVVAAGAQKAGLPAENIFFFDDPGEAVAWLTGRISTGDWILVKGSRRMGMEAVVELLKGL